MVNGTQYTPYTVHPCQNKNDKFNSMALFERKQKQNDQKKRKEIGKRKAEETREYVFVAFMRNSKISYVFSIALMFNVQYSSIGFDATATGTTVISTVCIE